MTMQFKKAERKQAKLRLALAGPSGAGKTMSALRIAKGMGGKIAVIDTERGSASLYSHVVDFDTLDLGPPYTPERYIDAIAAAEQAGYDTLIIDSITHEWDGKGGCLEMNENLANAKYKGNTWSAWNETTPRHRAFLDAIIQSKCHIIATMRSKTETVQGEGKKVMKLGMKVVQREGSEFEFTTVLDIVHDSHMATTSKDRTGLFADPHVITEDTGKRLLAWLNSGAALLDEPKPAPQPPAQPKPAGNPANLNGLSDERVAEIRKAFADANSISLMVEVWGKLTPEEKADKRVAAAKDERKAALTPQPQPVG